MDQGRLAHPCKKKKKKTKKGGWTIDSLDGININQFNDSCAQGHTFCQVKQNTCLSVTFSLDVEFTTMNLLLWIYYCLQDNEDVVHFCITNLHWKNMSVWNTLRFHQSTCIVESQNISLTSCWMSLLDSANMILQNVNFSCWLVLN